MQTDPSTHKYLKCKTLLLVAILALTACQAAPGSKGVDNPTIISTEIPTAVPSPTVISATSVSPEPSGGQAIGSGPHLLRETSVAFPYWVMWSQDGQRLIVSSEGSVTVFNPENLDPVATRSFQPPARLLDFSPDGTTLAYTPDGKTIALENIDSGQIVQTLIPEDGFQQASFSPDGKTLAVNSTAQMAFTLWDVASGQKGQALSGFVTAAPIYSGDFSPSGKKFIWWARGTIQIMDIATGALAAEIGHQDFITGFSLNQADNLLATAAGGNFKDEFTPLIYLWNPENGEQIAAYPQDKFASALSFLPDGSLLAAGIAGDVLLMDPANGQIIQKIPASGEAVSSLAFSPDGARLATAGSDGFIRLWRLR
jgi:WD40 repeat protein